MSNPSDTPTTGRIVHYTLKDGQVRPAMVLYPLLNDHVQLQVFVDGANDGENRRRTDSGISEEEGKRGLAWRTTVSKSKSGSPEPGCWHWPPRA